MVSAIEVVAIIELLAKGAVGALDAAIVFWPLTPE